MYDTILVPTDGSDHAVRAAEHARYLADAFDATVHVVTVLDLQRAGGPFDAGGLGEEFVGRLEAQGEEALETVRTVVDGEAVVTATLRGEPSETILEYAADHDVGLVAMGTHGRTGVDRYVAGSVTERVVSRSEAPVLTARATERSRVGDGYEEVLIPTDGSEPAGAAVEPGLAVAERTGARVHAVTVVDAGDAAASPGYSVPEEVTAHLEAEGEAATERIATQARERGLEATTAVRTGVAARDLLAYADEHDVDLVAMGTAGRTGLTRYLMGSTTERLIRHAEMPVLAVNARDRAGD
ncbi:universal stress protein [Salinirussus salinus]|jgi:nucleotide-binding universal stress UspA family protein|uniref:universal stress protein n=1 Tax=Salinirussus salinus TaxID=1198300 RepID=UPI001359A8E0|nr:universal stress protein [Salinirussus salinus]